MKRKKEPFQKKISECLTQLNLMLLYIKILPAHNAFRKEIIKLNARKIKPNFSFNMDGFTTSELCINLLCLLRIGGVILRRWGIFM